MAHEIGQRDVQVGEEVAWHELTIRENPITRDNCRIIYPMSLQYLHLPNGTQTRHKIVVSDDDGLPIGDPVTERYALITNEKIWDALAEALHDTTHRIVSCGTCSDRSRGFISVKLAEEFVAAERKTRSTLNVMWGHGGVLQVTAKTGFTVVVCRNTYNAAMNERGDFSFRTKHVGDAEVKLENMRDAIEAHTHAISEFRAAMEILHTQAISANDAQKFFAGFIVDDKDAEEEISTQRQNQYKELTRLFHLGAGNKGETRADVFNASTNYYTHASSGGVKNVRRQFESSEFGAGQIRKEETLTLLTGGKVARVGDFDGCILRGAKVLQVAA